MSDPPLFFVGLNVLEHQVGGIFIMMSGKMPGNTVFVKTADNILYILPYEFFQRSFGSPYIL